MTQVRVRPPTFPIFCNNPDGVGDGYQRYLQNKLREQFGFLGTPLRLQLRRRRKLGEDKPETIGLSERAPAPLWIDDMAEELDDDSDVAVEEDEVPEGDVLEDGDEEGDEEGDEDGDEDGDEEGDDDDLEDGDDEVSEA